MDSLTTQDRQIMPKIKALINGLIRTMAPHIQDFGKFVAKELLVAVTEMIIDIINGYTREEAYNRQIERTKKRLLNYILQKFFRR